MLGSINVLVTFINDPGFFKGSLGTLKTCFPEASITVLERMFRKLGGSMVVFCVVSFVTLVDLVWRLVVLLKKLPRESVN